MAKTEVRSEQIGDGQVKKADLNVSGTSGTVVIAKAVEGVGIKLSSTGTDAGTGDVTVAENVERALMMGVAGTITATMADAADFFVVIPFAMVLKRLKCSRKTAGGSATVVQVRRSTDSGASFANAFGSATFGTTALVATADPADLSVAEGDVLNFSIATGSGTNLLVEVIGTRV